MELTVHGFLFMDLLIKGFCMLKSFGAWQVSLHGYIAHVTFKSSSDAFHFRSITKGAEMDSEFTVRVELNEYLRNLPQG